MDTAKKIKLVHHRPSKVPLCPCRAVHSAPSPQENRDLLSTTLDGFAYSRIHTSGITQYVLSVSGGVMKPIPVSTCVAACSLLSPRVLHNPTTIHLCAVGHRGYFPFGVVVNKCNERSCISLAEIQVFISPG